jgi:cathepsin A (carboxypeptidase C)
VALFAENGPCAVNVDGTDTVTNPYSWNNNASIMYIDQPAGTGFSYGSGRDSNEDQVATDMYDFLQQFFQAHVEYQPNKFFVFGESYAGHYVPAVTHKIWKNNQNLPAKAVHLNLQGTAVGNGMTDPYNQFAAYPDMAVSTNGHAAAVGPVEYKLMQQAVPPCQAAIKECQTNVTACVVAIDICNLALLEPYTLTGLNPYDMRVKCAVPPLCYDFSNVGKYLALPAVQQYLNVNRKWADCARDVTLLFELSGDWMHSFQDQIPDQLAADIPVLLYAGDQDYICNWLGNHLWAGKMEWPYQTDWNAAPVQDWLVDGTRAGTLQQAHGFSFLKVLDAGHMVPMNQPKAALAMVNAFITGQLH